MFDDLFGTFVLAALGAAVFLVVVSFEGSREINDHQYGELASSFDFPLTHSMLQSALSDGKVSVDEYNDIANAYNSLTDNKEILIERLGAK
ncbi:hypothetical protein HJ082_03885 [Vibrio parahaemolyticus]|uniref:hypothetical protein n=1 Tax=Vibrio alginolyticus TaxID=663 RepID=UPI001DFDCB79|nr:hypothetical protein [Vibrio alginolyticus]MBE4228331.1 hypothetical protein [Vibrio parahaemolyticus]MCS0110211.1 hypothetical protein [Vibrio alginolyticus]